MTASYCIGSSVWPGLSKLIEEFGEVIQVAGKLLGSEGSTDHWSGDLGQMMVDELGDSLAAVLFFIHHNPEIDRALVFERMRVKQAVFERWHAENLERGAVKDIGNSPKTGVS